VSFKHAAAALAALGVTTLASSATIRALDVTRKSGLYSLEAETYIDAAPEAIFDVLLDYDRFGRISSVYKEYGFLDPAPDGTPIVYTRMEGCLVHFFCKSMRRVERLEAREPRYIRTTTLPEQSDFKYSMSEWTLTPEAMGTRMTYHLEMEPNFWVPPIVGPWLLKRTLWRGGSHAINRIERLARELELEGRTKTIERAGHGTRAVGLEDGG
jgi:Polyketide cyclase / dehydrase and lipid transport